LELPDDYRDFLVEYGGFGVTGGAFCRCQEPTPCGNEAAIDTFLGFTSPERSDNVVDQTEMIHGYPDVIAIGKDLMGNMIWLKCTGPDARYVYMYDHEARSA
jgi:hypothetical protein